MIFRDISMLMDVYDEFPQETLGINVERYEALLLCLVLLDGFYVRLLDGLLGVAGMGCWMAIHSLVDLLINNGDFPKYLDA